MNVPPSVTCTERVRMNAVFGLLFIFGGDAIMLYSILNNDLVNFGMLFACICGIAAIVLGFYYICCFLNKKITVSDEGVVYTSWMAKRQSYTWDQVSVSFHPGRNAYFIFNLGGKRATRTTHRPSTTTCSNTNAMTMTPCAPCIASRRKRPSASVSYVSRKRPMPPSGTKMTDFQ